MGETLIPLPCLAAELTALAGHPVASYRQLHRLVQDGVIPATKVGPTWTVERAALPGIADRLARLPLRAPSSIAA